jgi:hypothetical protein
LVHEQDPQADLVRVVLDHRNSPTGGALSAAFPPEQARRILRKLELQYTPKHGSWLNRAELELSVVSGQCLDRRLGDLATRAGELAAWERDRNAAGATITWRFTTPAARLQRHRLYPTDS